MTRLHPAIVWSLPGLLLLLLTACTSGSSATPDAALTSVPIRDAGAAASPPVAASATPADGPTGPGPQPGLACPVAAVLCEFAVQLEAAFEAGDVDAFLSLAQPVNATCTGQPASGTTPALCEAAAPGELRDGYWALQGGEGLVVTEAELRGGLARWFDAIARHSEATDAYGPGDLRIGSISCTRGLDQAGGVCIGNSLQVHFTFINPPDAQGTGLPGQRISFHVSASVVDGVPKANGFGTIVPPNSALVAKVIQVQDGTGNPLLVEVYPWTH